MTIRPIFAIAIAASEVAIGLAIFLAMYGKHESISLDDVDILRNWGEKLASSSNSEVILDSDLIQYAPLIILLPMLAFPVILFLGRIFNQNPFWKNSLKEGGLIALSAMAASFVISLLVIKDHIGSFAGIKDAVNIIIAIFTILTYFNKNNFLHTMLLGYFELKCIKIE